MKYELDQKDVSESVHYDLPDELAAGGRMLSLLFWICLMAGLITAGIFVYFRWF